MDEVDQGRQASGNWSPELAAKGLTTQKAPADLAAKFADLASRSAVTVRLHPRQGDVSDSSASKFAGNFLWPADEAWPSCPVHAEVLLTVMQLRKDEFPELALPPEMDLLQLLWCPLDHAELGHCPAPHIFLRHINNVTAVLESAPKPDEFEPDYYPSACRFHPERVLEYPSAFELPGQRLEEIDGWVESSGQDRLLEENNYQYLLSTAPGTKIGGHVNWITEAVLPDCEDCQKQMQHLLTIASVEYDENSFKRWCPSEELQVWNDSQAQSATELVLGDMGSLYIFVCRNCQPWKFKAIHQSN